MGKFLAIFLFVSFLTATQTNAQLAAKISEIDGIVGLLRELDRTHPNQSGLKLCTSLAEEAAGNIRAIQTGVNAERQLDEITYLSLSIQLSSAVTDLRTCAEYLAEDGQTETGPFGELVRRVRLAASDCRTFDSVMRALDMMRSTSTPKRGRSPVYSGPAGFNGFLDAIPAERRIRVARDGSGDHSTIGDAIAAVPKAARSYFLISIADGTYNEYVTVPKEQPYVILAGAGKGRTIITGNRSAATNWRTYYSATVAIFAQNFIGYNLTIANTAGPQGMQAVALFNRGNFTAFFQCSFEGYQDTLYAYSSIQFYRECDISGTVDFIFGSALAIFQSCTIYARQPIMGQSNTITAQKTNCLNEKSGFTIQSSIITGTLDLSNNTKSYLGRPWGNYSRVSFMLSELGGFIDPAGWLEWNAIDVYLGEYKNTGIGADVTGRVKWPGIKNMTDSEAYRFTVDAEFAGGYWLDSTGVPYTKGFN